MKEDFKKEKEKKKAAHMSLVEIPFLCHDKRAAMMTNVNIELTSALFTKTPSMNQFNDLFM